MKTHIKMAFGAILALGTVLHSIEAGNGKAPLGQINTHQMVVTQEVDAAFTTWTNSATVKFPKSSADKFYIGNKTLNQLLPTIPTETDPKFNEWYGTNDLAFTNGTVRFNATTNNFYIGGFPLSDYFGNFLTSFTETDPEFTTWLDGTNFGFNAGKEAAGTFKVNPEGGTAGFFIGNKSLKQLFEEEKDPQFSGFTNTANNISIGYGTVATQYNSVVVGVPAITYRSPGDFTSLSAGTGEWYKWRNDYIGNSYASRESVAIGDSAQARNPVSVAIGDQAIVGSLHSDFGRTLDVVLDKMEITTTYSNDVTTVTTNIVRNYFTNTYDVAMFERVPKGGTGWTRVEAGTPQVSGGVTNVVNVYKQTETGRLNDISYVPEDEWNMYDRLIYGGQGTNHLFNAFYGVAVGSRSYVFGYHSVAYGHYSHASRPFASAFGSESHVYSEGSQAFGYHTIIPAGSPYSLAIGMNSTVDAGLTNAIVIGVPQVVDFTNLTYRADEGRISYVPKAVKSNSINFAYHGNGIQDFFLDGISLSDRLVREVKVVGNTKDGTKPDDVDQTIREIGNIPDDEEPLVFYSGDGGIYFFTKGYEEDSEANIGDISKIFINGKPLSEIIEGSSSHDVDFAAYKTTVSNAAEVAINAINVSTNMTDVKSALTNFFNTIKQ